MVVVLFASLSPIRAASAARCGHRPSGGRDRASAGFVVAGSVAPRDVHAEEGSSAGLSHRCRAFLKVGEGSGAQLESGSTFSEEEKV